MRPHACATLQGCLDPLWCCRGVDSVFGTCLQMHVIHFRWLCPQQQSSHEDGSARAAAQTYHEPEDASAQPWAGVRARVFQPGSVTTRRFFSEHPMVLQVGSSLFVHAGLHPEHVDQGLSKINSVAQVWLPAAQGANTPVGARGICATTL